MFNGLILGKHRRPQWFAKTMRGLRRAGKIGEFVSIFVNEKQRCVYIASDGGRVCRPLVIAGKGVSRIKDCHMKELTVGYDKLGARQNVTVAVMSYSGYDIEDAMP
ncbi:DNA-directed RNA polymerase III subunit 2 [Dionaea muscipula]